MKSIAFIICGFLLAAAPAAASAQNVLFDETYTLVDLNNQVTSRDGTNPSQVTYSPQMRLRFYGDVHDGDAVRVIWKAGSTELANIRCGLSYSRGNEADGAAPDNSIAISDRCWGRTPVALERDGDINVEVHYLDDQHDTSTLLRTLHLHVGRTWRVDRVLSGRPIHSPRYYVRGDDLLGMSWVWLRAPSHIEPFGNAYFYFWANTDIDNYPDASFRCSRDGQRVPEFNLSGGNIHQSAADWEEQDDAIRHGQRASTRHHYRLFWITPNWRWGARRADIDEHLTDARPNLTAEPGNYVCEFRSEGEMVRSFQFTVAEGTIVPHSAQAAPGGLSMRPGAVFVETRFGAARSDETALLPAQIRRGTAFGHAWADPAGVAGMLGALPAARGASEPPLPDGVSRRGSGRPRGRQGH